MATRRRECWLARAQKKSVSQHKQVFTVSTFSNWRPQELSRAQQKNGKRGRSPWQMVTVLVFMASRKRRLLLLMNMWQLLALAFLLTVFWSAEICLTLSSIKKWAIETAFKALKRRFDSGEVCHNGWRAWCYLFLLGNYHFACTPTRTLDREKR